MAKLPLTYYMNNDVVWLARDLLGKVLVTETGSNRTSGIITETEAYSYRERGCHAYAGKFTKRTKVMFEPGGVAYVYLCYGIHHLFNIVSNKEGIAEAILIRGIYPLEGISHILSRRNKTTLNPRFFMGPGNVTRAMGISDRDNEISLCGNKIWLEDAGFRIQDKEIMVTPRIGIDYAGDDALLPWRFLVKDIQSAFQR